MSAEFLVDTTVNSPNDSQPPGYLQPSVVENTAARERQLEMWRTELSRLEYEIHTLQSVLSIKMREADELKRKLGISFLTEMKDDLQHGVQTVRDSNVYQKTNAALHNLGDYASRKLGVIRSSSMYKSFEEKVGGAYSSVRTRIASSRSVDNVHDNTRPSVTTDESLQSPPPVSADKPTV